MIRFHSLRGRYSTEARRRFHLRDVPPTHVVYWLDDGERKESRAERDRDGNWHRTGPRNEAVETEVTRIDRCCSDN